MKKSLATILPWKAPCLFPASRFSGMTRLLTAAVFFVPLFSLSQVQANEPLVLRTSAQIGGAPKFMGRNNEHSPTGFCPDLLEAIETADPGLKFKGQDQWRTLSRIVYETSTGKLDLACGLQASDDRRHSLHVIDFPVWTVDYHLLSRQDDTAAPQNWADVQALSPDNVVLVNAGSSVIKKLEDLGIRVDSSGQSLQQNIDKLWNRRARFYYVRRPGLKQTGANNLGNLRIHSSALGSETFYMMVSPHLPDEVVQRISISLQKLEQNGVLQGLRDLWGEEELLF
ncbi:transporter substrate-binding domain-containing protein [Kiloniella laminariae]|uniref:Transporter substrate-binding domain-containing protein n=1 Tax=Kiloniella laminariae TaxID=454162 RepID=A0ABT4LFJ4_9PROT|nr:transporter substrate-binding domain-containing protein [Kiloniella laminariae]MCZ4279859.1 transporter substrate-binding domain-containing protein [Kiloniella laminariae]